MKKILLLTLLLISITANAEILGLSARQFVGFTVSVQSRNPAVIAFRYGTAPDKLTTVIHSFSLVNDYTFFVELPPNKVYYWKVLLRDINGNLIQQTTVRQLITFKTP